MARLLGLYSVFALTLASAPAGADAPIQIPIGDFTRECPAGPNNAVGPEAGIEKLASRAIDVDSLFVSGEQCFRPPDGYRIDIEKILNQDVWADNSITHHWRWGANQAGACGPLPHCYGVLFTKPLNEKKLCYATFVRPAEINQRINDHFTPCIPLTFDKYGIGVTISPPGSGTVTSNPEDRTTQRPIIRADITGDGHFDRSTHVILNAAEKPNGPRFLGWTGDPECTPKSEHIITIVPTKEIIRCTATFQ